MTEPRHIEAAAGARPEVESAADPMRPEPYRVVRTRAETHDAFTLTLEPVREGARLTFEAGQFNMLYAPGVGEAAISMSGPPGTVHRVVHTIRAVGRVTRTLQRLKRGAALGLRGPFGTAWPVSLAEGGDVVLVAGGVGLAPLRPVVYHVLEQRERFGRVCLLFGARTPRDILFAKEIETWRGRLDLEVEVTVDRAAAGWHGLVGVVPSLIPRARFDPASAVAFVCGPEIMMHFTAGELAQRGVPSDRVWISMERNMRCGFGLCGHCQFGPFFVCKDGPKFR